MSYALQVDLGDLLGANGALAAELFPRVQQGVELVAAEVAMRWRDAVMKAPLRAVERGAYIDGIAWQMTGPLAARVSVDYAPAEEIETGRAPVDLKLRIAGSRNARVVTTGKNKGQKYLIIPFRHNVPSSGGALAPPMPQRIYDMARELPASRVLAPGSKNPATRVSATGHTVAQHSYAWGGRLPAGLVRKSQPHHATDRYAGMVRFDTSKGKAKSSAYMTFRVMRENSVGWIIPARPGLYLLRETVEPMSPIFDDVIRQALKLGG